MPSDHDGSFWRDITKPGTKAHALLCGMLGVAVALSFLFIGFWKTALIAVFFATGWLLGGNRAVRAWFVEMWTRLTRGSQ